MAEPQAAEPQQAEAAPVVTPAQTSQEKRDTTFKARQAKAARRLAERAGKAPESEAKEEPAKPEEPKPEEKPPEAKKAADVDKRHAIAERREKRVQAREEKTKTREDNVSRAEAALNAKFGAPEAAATAYNKGEYHTAAKYMQKIFGDDFATITQKIARATAGLAPEKLKELEERDNFAREKREWEAQKKKEEESKKTTATRSEALKTVASKIAGHDALKLKNGSELVLRELEQSWDGSGFKVTFKQAADKVVADKLAEAEALGARRVAAKIVEAPVAKPPPKTTIPVVAQVEKKRLSFDERHAAAGRLAAKRRT